MSGLIVHFSLMRASTPPLLALFFLIVAGCGKKGESGSGPSTPHSSAKAASAMAPVTISSPNIDACGLLTSVEIESVTGETAEQPVPSARSEGGLAVAQCYFTVKTPAKSVVVTVTTRASGADAKEPSQFWAETFHRESRQNKGGEEEEQKQAPLEKVEGLGDEAYWAASGSTGALYVLKANSFIRVAVGGPDGKDARLAKAKTVAGLVLKRL